MLLKMMLKRKKAETCKLDLKKKRKEEIEQHFSKMAEDVDQKKEETKRNIDAEIEAILRMLVFF